MGTKYKWQKYNCNASPVWGVRQKATTGSRSYSIVQKAAYTSSSGKAHPIINSSGQFTFTDGGSEVLSTSNWQGKYWIANNDSIKLSTTTSSTSNYYAVITSCTSGFLAIRAEATIYESYQSGTSYSQGTFVGDILEDSRSAHPDNGRDANDGYWYVYVGEISDRQLTVSYNGSTITSYTTQSLPITVKFTNGANITTVDVGQTKTLTCKNKIARDNITVGIKTLTCKNTKMADNIIISVT